MALLVVILPIAWVVPFAIVVMAPGLCLAMHGLTRDYVKEGAQG